MMKHKTLDVLTKLQPFGLLYEGEGASYKRIKANVTCADPGLICPGGGGVQGRLPENSPDNICFLFRQLIS